MYADYLAEQIDLLVQDYGVKVEVGKSAQQMTFPYVLEGLDMSALDCIAPIALARYFPATELAEIRDEIADGRFLPNAEGGRHVAPFTVIRQFFLLKWEGGHL